MVNRMAYKYREELVGKRFLSVCGYSKLKLNKISGWVWRAGVIRAASHKDNTNKELQVLVEYDYVDWRRREWISVYKDGAFHVFLVEAGLVWSDRLDPLANGMNTSLWPGLSFTPLVDSVGMSSYLQPVEFLLDNKLSFREFSRLHPFSGYDRRLALVREHPELQAAVRRWETQQDGQRILLATPSVLVGYRVQVYRAEGTTQWYTAVIVGYNESTKDLTVTDDTVLEEHNEDPCLVQMRLIGDGVVDSIMRGESVGIISRRSRSSAVPSTWPVATPRVNRSIQATTQSSGSRRPRGCRPARSTTPEQPSTDTPSSPTPSTPNATQQSPPQQSAPSSVDSNAATEKAVIQV